MAEPSGEFEALLRDALRAHDGIVAAYRAGGRRTPEKHIDTMRRVKERAVALGAYPAPSSVLRGDDDSVHLVLAFTGGNDSAGVMACGLQVKGQRGFTPHISAVTCPACLAAHFGSSGVEQ